MAEPLTVACVQMRSGTDQNANIGTMRDFVREAAGEGATYVQTPEMTGLVERGRKDLFAAISPDYRNPVFGAASQLARELGIWLHVGSTAVKLDGDRAANRAALFSPKGERVAFYDKIHMFDVDLDNGESWRESSVYAPGDEAVVAAVGRAMIGLAICYDLRFPALFRAQAQAGSQILTVPSCFTRQTGRAHWHALLRSRAIENGAFVVAAAQGGKHDDGRESYGHSLIADPWGKVVAELDHDEPGVLVHEIDIGEVIAARSKIQSLRHDRHFDLVTVSGEDASAGKLHGAVA